MYLFLRKKGTNYWKKIRNYLFRHLEFVQEVFLALIKIPTLEGMSNFNTEEFYELEAISKWEIFSGAKWLKKSLTNFFFMSNYFGFYLFFSSILFYKATQLMWQKVSAGWRRTNKENQIDSWHKRVQFECIHRYIRQDG